MVLVKLGYNPPTASDTVDSIQVTLIPITSAVDYSMLDWHSMAGRGHRPITRFPDEASLAGDLTAVDPAVAGALLCDIAFVCEEATIFRAAILKP